MRSRFVIILLMLMFLSPARGRSNNPALNLDSITIENVNHLQELTTLGYRNINEIIDAIDEFLFVGSVAFDPSGNILALGSMGTIYLWNIEQQELHATLLGHSGAPISALRFSNEGTLLASGAGGRPSRDQTLRIWDAQRGESVNVLYGHQGGIYDIAFSPDGTTLFSASGDGSIRMWDIITQKSHILNQDKFPDRIIGLETLAINPNGSYLAYGGYEGIIRIMNVLTRQESILLDTFPDSTLVSSISYSPDGRLLVAGLWTGHIQLWNVDTGEEHTQLEAARGSTRLAFSPDGLSLISVSRDNTVHFWDIFSEEEQHINLKQGLVTSLGRVETRDISISPNGKLLALARLWGGVQIWGVPSTNE